MTDSRIVTPSAEGEDRAEVALRPQLLDDFIGQREARENLRVFIHAARERGEAGYGGQRTRVYMDGSSWIELGARS